MTVEERLTEELKTSMKAGDAERTGVLRLLRGAMKNETIKRGQALSDDDAIKVLQREAKQRRDSVEQFRAGGREDLVAKEESELAVIQDFLPQPMDEDTVKRAVDEVVTEQGATDMKQMGAVMGAVMARLGAGAEGGTVSRLVRERLGRGE